MKANKNEECKVFFALYDNGETFYFNVNEDGEIHCREFDKLYSNSGNSKMQPAFAVEFTENDFSLKDETGETIYSLNNYQKTTTHPVEKFSLGEDNKPTIEKLYIDDEVCLALLTLDRLRFDEKASQILGLKPEKPTTQQVKPYTRTRHI